MPPLEPLWCRRLLMSAAAGQGAEGWAAQGHWGGPLHPGIFVVELSRMRKLPGMPWDDERGVSQVDSAQPDPGKGLRFCASGMRSRLPCSKGRISELKLSMKFRTKKVLSRARIFFFFFASCSNPPWRGLNNKQHGLKGPCLAVSRSWRAAQPPHTRLIPPCQPSLTLSVPMSVKA